MTGSPTASTATLRGSRLWLALAVALALVGALTWMDWRARATDPRAHEAYTQALRDLRELDARVDQELLSNRLDQSRNYDALTREMARSLQTVASMLDPPVPKDEPDHARAAASARAAQVALLKKADSVDLFKRDNSVLRNSRTYFVVATGRILDAEATSPSEHALHMAVGRYTRQVLARLHDGSTEARQRCAAAAQALRSMPLTAGDRQRVDVVLQHGEMIASRLDGLDAVLEQVEAVRSGAAIDILGQDYARAHAAAETDARRYRRIMYVLGVMIAACLGWLVLRLALAQRSLAQAHREVSERFRAQQLVEQQLMLHATAFRSAHDGITLTDAQGTIVDVNPAFTRITGWERDEVVGRNPRFLKSGQHDEAFYNTMWDTIRRTGSWRGEIWNRNKFGVVYPELLSISAVRNDADEVTNYVAVFADIGRLKTQERQLMQMAYYDALTELPNRTLLADRLAQGVAHTRRSGGLMAVCYLDLDGFKPINDTWGHEAGDRVLVEMAARLKRALRGGDTVARLGGDEFALLMLDLAGPRECEEAVRRVINVVSQPLTTLPESLCVTASVGVALYPADDADPDTLLRHADQTMYLAKQAGKNGFLIFNAEAERTTQRRRDHVADLRQALERGELVLHYQPKVDMRRGRVVGVEGLLRWQHPEHGILEPAAFLPMLEQTDVATDLGLWVAETAARQAAHWAREGLPMSVGINVAGDQLLAAGFVDRLAETLGRYPLAARLLELEILESAALTDLTRTAEVIKACRDLQVQVSLDDFGAGYSSLSYLKRLPVETIKIDQSFVRELLTDQDNLVIVHGVIDLARAFQRKAIAEGVESVEHGRLLLQLQCDLAQGHGVARPMAADQVAPWVRQWQPDPSWLAVRDLYWADEDYGVLTAEVKARQWVAQVLRAVAEGRPVPHEHFNDPGHCCFGAWYSSEGQALYGDVESFRRIDAAHQQLHEVVAIMDRLWRDGHHEAMRAEAGRLVAAQSDLLQRLFALQIDVASRRRDARPVGPVKCARS